MPEVKSWMHSVRLKMNTSKTEFIMFGYGHQLQNCETNSIEVLGDTIEKSTTIKYLGAWLDKCLTLKQHVQKKCCTALSNYFKICNIRKYPTTDACETPVLGLCISILITLIPFCTSCQQSP